MDDAAPSGTYAFEGRVECQVPGFAAWFNKDTDSSSATSTTPAVDQKTKSLVQRYQHGALATSHSDKASLDLLMRVQSEVVRRSHGT
jgi:hypothetical protein